jgi:hypothetical protein
LTDAALSLQLTSVIDDRLYRVGAILIGMSALAVTVVVVTIMINNRQGGGGGLL